MLWKDLLGRQSGKYKKKKRKESNVEYGVLMETDDAVNYNVDVLLDVLHAWPYALSLTPRHSDDPENYDQFLKQYHVSKKTTPYIHAHIIWNYRALPFLRDLRSLFRRGHFQGSNFDETGVNVMLWAAQANHTLCKYGRLRDRLR